MTKSPSKKRIIKPPLDRFGGIRVVKRRIEKSEIIEHHKDAVAQELVDIGTASINEIIDWDSTGYVRVRSPDEISDRAIKAIKKIKMTPTKEGPQLEVELHDKVSVLRVLAKASGLLDTQENMDKPSVVGITMHGPDTMIEEAKIVNDKNDKKNDTKRNKNSRQFDGQKESIDKDNGSHDRDTSSEI